MIEDKLSTDETNRFTDFTCLELKPQLYS